MRLSAIVAPYTRPHDDAPNGSVVAGRVMIPATTGGAGLARSGVAPADCLGLAESERGVVYYSGLPTSWALAGQGPPPPERVG